MNFDVLAGASLNTSLAVTVKEGAVPKKYRDRKIEVHDLFVDHDRRKVVVHINGSQPIELDMTEFVPSPAGSSFNVTVGLNRLGLSTAIMGAVGNDMFATQLANSLEQANIPFMAIPRGMGTPVTLSVIEQGSREASTTLFNFKPPYELPINKAIELLNSKQYRFVLGTGVRKSEVELMTRLFTFQQDNLLVPNESVCSRPGDPNVRLLLKLTNKIQVNLEEAQVLSNSPDGDLHKMVHIISGMGPKKVIITRDRDGVFLGRFDNPSHPKHYEQPAFPTQVVDSDGAGDAFSVGFVYSLLSGHRIKKSLEVGTFVASRNIQAIGGYGGMPTYEEVAELLK